MAEAAVEAEGERTRPAARLPHLEGRRGRIVRWLYLAAALAALIVIAGSFWFNARDHFGNMPTTASYGFRTRTGDMRPAVAGPTRADAIASGLRPGDRILAIDGEPMPETATEFTIAERLAADGDGRVTLLTRSRDGAVRSHVLAKKPVTAATVEPVSHLPLWLFITLNFVTTQLPLLVWFAASVLLARQRPRDPEAMLFAFGFLLICVNGGAAFWLNALVGVPLALLQLLTNFGGCLLLAAIAGFPDGRFPSLASRLALLAAAVLALFTVAGALLPVSPPVGLMFLVCNLAVLASLAVRYRRTGSQLERQQIKWAVLGFAAGLALFLPTQIGGLLGLLGGSGAAGYIVGTIFPNLALLLMPLGLLVSLLRYRLYDADAVISRSAAYAVLTLMLGAVFAATQEGMKWLFETNFGRDAGALPSAVGAGLAVAVITPLHNRIHGWAERRFQKALMHLRRDLPERVSDLRETSDLQGLAADVAERTAAGVRAARAAVLIGGEVAAAAGSTVEEATAWSRAAAPDAGVESLDCDRADPQYPMRVPLRVRDGGEAPLGWILLGPRPDGSFYGRDEREALAEIADPVARAVQVVLAREAREARLEARLAGLERRLERALGRIEPSAP